MHQSRLTQLALAFGRFLGENVAGVSLVATDVAGASFAEPLGGTTIGFDFGHDAISFYILLFDRRAGSADTLAAYFFGVITIDMKRPIILGVVSTKPISWISSVTFSSNRRPNSG